MRTFTSSVSSLAGRARQALLATLMLATLGAHAETLSILAPDTTVNQGDTFTLDVQGGSFAKAIYGGGFNLSWDPAVLQLNSVQIPASWEFAPSAGTLDAAAGTVSDVSFNTFVAPRGGDFLTATLSFTAIGVGDSAVTPAASLNLPFGDIDGQPVTVAFVPGMVHVMAAVPEPASLSLLLIGMAGIAAVSRRPRG